MLKIAMEVRYKRNDTDDRDYSQVEAVFDLCSMQHRIFQAQKSLIRIFDRVLRLIASIGQTAAVWWSMDGRIGMQITRVRIVG